MQGSKWATASRSYTHKSHKVPHLDTCLRTVFASMKPCGNSTKRERERKTGSACKKKDEEAEELDLVCPWRTNPSWRSVLYGMESGQRFLRVVFVCRMCACECAFCDIRMCMIIADEVSGRRWRQYEVEASSRRNRPQPPADPCLATVNVSAKRRQVILTCA